MRVLGWILAILWLGACTPNEPSTIRSPDKSITVNFLIDHNNSLIYTVFKNGEPILLESRLGLEVKDSNFKQGVTIGNVTKTKKIKEHYRLVAGKKTDIRVSANQKVITLVNRKNEKLDVVLRVSNDGVGIRYQFQTHAPREFLSESTSFRFATDAKAWLQPIAKAQTGWARVNPSYEEHYEMAIPVGTESPTGAGWVFPALFQTGNYWVLLSEAGIQRDWHVSRLASDSLGGEYTLGVPMEMEEFPGRGLYANSKGDFISPWRTIAIGDLKNILESTLVTDLADSAAPSDWSWVKTGHASWSWVLLKDEHTVFDVQKKFIDYAAEMKWDYTLIDAEWDKQIGDEKLRELVNYAATKNIGVWVWFNSSGDWNDSHQTPKSELLTAKAREAAFSKMAAMGIKGLKIDFFAGDGQSMMEYYLDILDAAAKHKLMINFHGATLPRGLQRTYPHLMTVEAIKGFEFTTFSQADEDAVVSHVAMAPFARNVYDDMDYTPMVFGDIPDITRTTTNSFELAQSVLFTSGVQHFAEIPEGMAQVPDYVKKFLNDLPTYWDDVKFIEGVPGEYIVIGRRLGNEWYIAGVNAKPTAQTITLDLSFVKDKVVELITPGQDARSFNFTTAVSATPPVITLKHAEGFVVHVH
jgi:alpha-glucosidase